MPVTPFSSKGKTQWTDLGLQLSCSSKSTLRIISNRLALCVICMRKRKKQKKTKAWLIVLVEILPGRDSPSSCNYNISENSTTSHHGWHICWTELHKHSLELLICLGFQDNLAARETLVSNKRSSDANCQINPNLSMSTYSVLTALPTYWANIFLDTGNPIKMHHRDTIMCSFVRLQSIPLKEILRNQ